MANQASNPVRRFRRGQARQFRHLSGVRLMAGQARNLAARSHLRLTAKVARYHLQNMAGRRRESLVRVQVPPRVVLRIFRHKVAARAVADRARNRVLRFRLDQAKRFRPLNEARLAAGRARNRVARFHLNQARQFHHLSGARLAAGRAHNRAARLLLRLTAKVARCRLQSVAGHRRASWVKVQVPARVVLRIFRHKAAARDPRLKDSVIRRRRARVHMSAGARNSDHNPQLANQPRRRLRVGLRMKRAAREKEAKVPMVNLAGHHQKEPERPLLAGRRKVRPPRREPSVARASQSAERKSQNHHRPDHNNSGVICESGSGRNSRAAFFVRMRFVVVGRLCQTVRDDWRFTGRSGGGHQRHRRAGRGRNEGERMSQTPYKFYSNSAICTAFNAAPLSN